MVNTFSWMGRLDEALAESERARQLDPLSLIIASDRAHILYRARQYDRAVAQARAVLEMDASFLHPTGPLIWSYVEENHFPDALDAVNRFIRPRSEAWALEVDAAIYGRWGRITEAERDLKKVEELDPHDSPARRHAFLDIYIAIGQKDQAIALLQRAFAERSDLVNTLKVDPSYDSLRSDPRFQDLLRRVGLAQ